MENEATLKENEPHPSAHIAMNFLAEQKMQFKDWMMMQEAIASNAIEGNRMAEICLSTIRRLEEGKPVSDRYLMGLAWMVYSIKNNK